MEIKKSKSDVPALETTIRILDFLSGYDHRSSSLADICKALSINKSTCHRILKALEQHNYVFYDEENKLYSLGSYLVVLGNRAAEFIDYLEICKPYLRALSEEVQQTIVLLEPVSNNQLMYIAKEEPPLPIRVTVNLGQRFPLTIASFGKCYAAFMEEEKAVEIFKDISTRQITDKMITDVELFKKELKTVREKGYAESYEEYTPGVCGVASPIFNMDGEVMLVASCLFLSGDPNLDVSVYGEKIRGQASLLTKLLGGKFPPGVSF